MMREDPQLVIDEFGSSHPNALRLAEVVSIAVRVEPELLRMARLTLLPDANAGDEADLWFSPLVKIRNSLGFVFYPEIVSILRKRLKDQIGLLDDIWYKVFVKVHRNISRALFIEELITWKALRNSDDPKIEKLLLRTLSAIVDDDDQNGISYWILRALPNFPDSTCHSKITPMLKLGARLRLGDKDSFLDIKESVSSESMPEWIYKLVPSNLETVKIGVHFVEAGIEVGNLNLMANPAILELPATNPLQVEVSWKGKSSQTQTKSIWLEHNEKVFFPVDVHEVKLKTLLGNRYKLYKKFNENLSNSSTTNGKVSQLIRDAYEKNYTKLDLSDNQLTQLPPEIGESKNISSLDLSYNILNQLPSGIKNLNNLTELDVSHNQFASFPSEILELKSLSVLNLSENLFTSLSQKISKLKNLTRLLIYGNQLTSIPPEISELKNLTELDLSDNQLISIPPEISKLKNLTQLNIAGNQLISIPPEILELDLEIEWQKRWGPRAIYLPDNPFENPPVEIVKKGREAVLVYFKSLEGEKKPLSEVKVLLVGDGGAGKTSLVKRLVGEEFDGNEYQTQGINIKEWRFKNKKKEIKVNFWDFGGQEIMHATHQFFLSKRSLYILVLDGRRDEKAEYWLKFIENFGGDSPILIVLNKIDEYPSYDLNRKFLQEKYPSIKGFFRTSCKDNSGIEAVSRELQKELLKMEHLQIEWTKSWFKVRNRLENMSSNFITYEEYQNICLEENVDDNSSQNTLDDFLNDLGVFMHFKDITLLNTYVLEPRWIIGGIYKIINSEILAKKKGVLRFSMLDGILERKKTDDYYYPYTCYDFIINLMKKFEL